MKLYYNMEGHDNTYRFGLLFRGKNKEKSGIPVIGSISHSEITEPLCYNKKIVNAREG